MHFSRIFLCTVLVASCCCSSRAQQEGYPDKNTLKKVRANTRMVQVAPCSCTRNEPMCSCCVKVDIDPVNFHRTGCARLTYNKEDVGVNVDFTLDGKVLYQNEVSARNPPPVCASVPQLPFLMFCARFYDIQLQDGSIRVCMNIEARVARAPVAVVQFDCVRASTESITFEKPPQSHRLDLTLPNPQPLCVPMPRLPYVTICTQLHSLQIQNGNTRFCVSMEARVSSHPVYKLDLGCMNSNNNGVLISRPRSKI